MKINKIALLIFVFIASSCASVDVPTANPTDSPPTSTFTPIPTNTSTPTFTPSPTATETEAPTFTPGPSPTPEVITSNNAVVIPVPNGRSLVWSRDGNYLYIGTSDKGVTIYDVVNKKIFATVGNDTNISSLAISPNGKILAVGIANDGSIRLWAVENIRPEYEVLIFPAHGTKGFGYDVLALAFSPDGKLLASRGYDGKIIIWDVASAKLIKEIEVADIGNGLEFSPDGKTLIAGLNAHEEYDIWSTDTWEIQSTFEGDQAWDLSLSADGNKMVSAGWGIHEANLWDVRTGELLFNFQKETEGLAETVSYDPSGKLVALGGGGGVVFLWDASTGILVKKLYIDKEFNNVFSVAFSPDGTQIATAGGNQVIIWNLSTP